MSASRGTTEASMGSSYVVVSMVVCTMSTTPGTVSAMTAMFMSDSMEVSEVSTLLSVCPGAFVYEPGTTVGTVSCPAF